MLEFGCRDTLSSLGCKVGSPGPPLPSGWGPGVCRRPQGSPASSPPHTWRDRALLIPCPVAVSQVLVPVWKTPAEDRAVCTEKRDTPQPVSGLLCLKPGNWHDPKWKNKTLQPVPLREPLSPGAWAVPGAMGPCLTGLQHLC